MRCASAVLLLMLLATFPVVAIADAGRDAPTCQTLQASSLPPTVSLADGTCAIVDLGVLSSGDVYEVSVIVVDDAIDLLFFDENSIQPYELGQSYRASMVQPASAESVIGGQEFHWKVPPSAFSKRWYMVLDNQAHDGDAGEGDQGGATSVVSASVTMLTQSYWTPFNDLVGVDVNAHTVLLSGEDLRLDEGTTVVLSAWALEFEGDVFLQTRAMYDRYVVSGVGVQFVEGGALQGVVSSQSLTWQVPASLEGEELLLVVDNTNTPLGGGDGTSALRMTVRLELSPPLTPSIADDNGGQVALGDSIVLDASSTPNRLGQQGTFSWDLDTSVDSNGDGNNENDIDVVGVSVTASWDSPGDKSIRVQMTAPSGQTASSTYTLTVNDITPPVARLQGVGGTPVAEGWRVNVGDTVVLNCESSTDDDAVSACAWTVDGEAAGNETTISLSWDDVGEHTVNLSVTDMSGNTATSTAVVRNVDSSLPRFDPSSFAGYPTEVVEGDAITFSVSVNDTFDPANALRVHWDLNPVKDSDGNDNPRDDPDLVGLSQRITFDTAGDQSIVITVFDASNNSDSYAFVVAVDEAETVGNSYGLLAAIVIGIVLVMGLGVAGYGVWQRRLAFDMLLNRGLDEDEARGHMAMVAQRTSLPLFASAVSYAGLDQGEVVSAEEREAAQRQAEIDAIYGSSNEVDPAAAFAPTAYTQAPLSEASSAAAAEAAALLSEGVTSTFTDVATTSDPLNALMDEAPEQVSGGVALPGDLPTSAPASPSNIALPVDLPVDVQAATEDAVGSPPMLPPPASAPPTVPPPSLLRHTCSSCGALFELDLPSGVNSAIIACPSCGHDETITASGQ